MATTLTGGCLCGGVRYEATTTPTTVYFCHCTQCQKAQGTAFVASVPIALDAFKITRGQALLKAFRATPVKGRFFCGECGSPLYSFTEGKSMVRVRAGSFDTPPPLKLAAHIYTASKAPWYEINDDAPQYEGIEPGRQ